MSLESILVHCVYEGEKEEIIGSEFSEKYLIHLSNLFGLSVKTTTFSQIYKWAKNLVR